MTVAVPTRPYEVTVGSDLLGSIADHLPALPGAERAFVVSDRRVSAQWYEPLERGLQRLDLPCVHLPVPEGEEAKTLQVYGAVLQQLATQEAHRADPVLALGGGSVGDLAGFVAATYMRGVPFVQVPTTLTAQVDAAIGGKTAVNLPEGKNLAGVFHQPVAVIADVTTLEGLDARAFGSGLAEVGKYALALDPSLLTLLESSPAPLLAREPACLEDVITRCVRVKARAVAADEHDTAERLFLNYGHTLGHALERLGGFGEQTHGEAISIGMVFAAQLSERLSVGAPGLLGRTIRLLASLGLPTAAELPPAAEILAALRLDKKYRGGVRFVLLTDVGSPTVVEDVPDATIREILEEMGAP